MSITISSAKKGKNKLTIAAGWVKTNLVAEEQKKHPPAARHTAVQTALLVLCVQMKVLSHKAN